MDNTKERPIIFNAQEVNALLAGNKTQHRSVITPKMEGVGLRFIDYGKGWQAYETDDSDTTLPPDDLLVKCPFGQVGDRLWVQESHARTDSNMHFTAPHYYAEGPLTLDLRHDAGLLTKYSAADMPRWASRLLLEITDIRIERVQDISAADVLATGMTVSCHSGLYSYIDANKHKIMTSNNHKSAFARYWDSMHGKDSSKRNDWVWVIEFKVIKDASNG